MTPAQKRLLKELHSNDFVEHGGWGRAQRNRPLWALVEMGLAEFRWGPRGSWLKTQGFLPLWGDPVV